MGETADRGRQEAERKIKARKGLGERWENERTRPSIFSLYSLCKSVKMWRWRSLSTLATQPFPRLRSVGQDAAAGSALADAKESDSARSQASPSARLLARQENGETFRLESEFLLRSEVFWDSETAQNNQKREAAKREPWNHNFVSKFLLT